MTPFWSRNLSTALPRRIETPQALIKPGAVARSVIIGFFGVNPNLHRVYPSLAAQLIERQESIELPDDFQLRFAIAKGRTARVAGSIGGYFAIGPRLNDEPIGCMSHGQVYFPPLAWQVVPRRLSLLDMQGWADVSSWLTYSPNDEATVQSLCPALPAVVHPLHHPAQWKSWLEMFSSEITEIVECEYLPDD